MFFFFSFFHLGGGLGGQRGVGTWARERDKRSGVAAGLGRGGGTPGLATGLGLTPGQGEEEEVQDSRRD